ncbi:MAG: ribosome biogenesis GTP-binding protein YihA/YsxC [Bacteroidota bacterium]
MKILSVKFVKSSSVVKDCPETQLPEYAFAGRSNVGKSSLINMLLGNKKLAKTSSTPGKTQLLNHFLVNEEWFLCDLPGYGYAKSSKKDIGAWDMMVREYIAKRDNLSCVCVLIDSRIPPQNNDMHFLRWLGTNGVPFIIIFTKVDKLSRTKIEANINSYKQTLLEEWEELPMIFNSSSETQNGKMEILEFIEKTNVSLKNQQ